MEAGPATNSSGDSREGGMDSDDGNVAWNPDRSGAGTSMPFSQSGRAFFDDEENLKFYPPLYRQRYETVRDILNDSKWAPPVVKVVEFGCAELAMFSYFKQIPHVENIFMIDIDSNVVDYYSCRAAPLSCDFLSPRESPLHVEVLCGSVADYDVRLLGASAVVCIELIEHLELDVVEKMQKTIFEFIEPEIAIFTTPNSDFNVLLKGMKGKFRHYDHKFEWSRSEFLQWTNSVTSEYPHYRVEISGVGVPPEGCEDVGFCSQLALFIRSNNYTPALTKKAQEVYSVCRIYDHPVKEPDLRSDKDKLQDEISYRMSRLGYFEHYQQEEDEDCALIPLLDLTTAVQGSIPTASMESIRCMLPAEDIIEKNGHLFVTFNLNSGKSDSSLYSDEEKNDTVNFETVSESNFSEERWDEDSAPVFAEPRFLTDYHMALATFDNAANLVNERQSQIDLPHNDWIYDEHQDDDDDDDDEYNAEGDNVALPQDCERQWNSTMPLRHPLAPNQDPKSSAHLVECRGSVETGSSQNTNFSRDEFACGSVCTASSQLNSPDEQENIILSAKREPITDSGVDLSPLLNVSYLQDEMGDVFPGLKWEVEAAIPLKSKELPKSTSVEVLHLDGSCTLKRRAGLEYVEFAPSTSVALCYTGQTYCHLDKIPANSNMSISSERKSLDGSLVRDVADSCSLDFAADSGYPNSSSLHHDVDVDLTPEQVDDISSENDERSNQSLSEDELSDSSDRGPALPRRVIHPRHPIVPIVFENVENGDLANNNRDGEGNNAVAPQGDEREFVALVQEGDMQPLLAAPVADDGFFPNHVDPFPDWLMDLLKIEDGDDLPVAKMVDELEYDEGLGEDTV